jgi:hypothetical protein
MLMPLLSDLNPVFPSERSARVITARQLHAWCATLRTSDETSPLPLRDLRRWTWRALAGVSAIDVAATERQRNGVIRHVRDRLRRAAVALLTLSDLGLIDRTAADLGRSLIAHVDELLAAPPEPSEQLWLDEGSEKSEQGAPNESAPPETPSGDAATATVTQAMPAPVPSPLAAVVLRGGGTASPSRRRGRKRRH